MKLMYFLISRNEHRDASPEAFAIPAAAVRIPESTPAAVRIQESTPAAVRIPESTPAAVMIPESIFFPPTTQQSHPSGVKGVWDHGN